MGWREDESASYDAVLREAERHAEELYGERPEDYADAALAEWRPNARG